MIRTFLTLLTVILSSPAFAVIYGPNGRLPPDPRVRGGGKIEIIQGNQRRAVFSTNDIPDETFEITDFEISYQPEDRCIVRFKWGDFATRSLLAKLFDVTTKKPPFYKESCDPHFSAKGVRGETICLFRLAYGQGVSCFSTYEQYDWKGSGLFGPSGYCELEVQTTSCKAADRLIRGDTLSIGLKVPKPRIGSGN